jgi:amidophosphoribosyltransferase
MKLIDGAYSMTVQVNNRIFGVRDPYGFRPLALGRLHDGYAIASESCVFEC